MESMRLQDRDGSLSTEDLLQKSRKEIDRLVKNKAAFYEIFPDMIFIISDFVIEDMNNNAVKRFGDLRGKKCYKSIFNESEICQHSTCPINKYVDISSYGEIHEKKVADFWYEYSHIPFEGYSADTLVMLIMRDITKRKQFEFDLHKFNADIENVLIEKISGLEESEKTRNNLKEELNVLTRKFSRLQKPDQMIGSSRSIQEIREMVYQVADSDATILITGESGTGKELVADLIHQHSDRKDEPYLKFNCAAVPETLLESDLFGYEKGAYTGATKTRKGKFEIADGGTIFLDEIGDISPKMQASLLRVLQNGEIIRVGATHPISVNVRIIAATNVDLTKAVENKTFRSDLYYRLNVINLHLPLLQERIEDITPLTVHFLEKYRKAFKKNITFFPESIIEKLLRYHWPGNIRELENTIQRAVLLCKGGSITEKDLDYKIRTYDAEAEQLIISDDFITDNPLNESISHYESKVIAAALRKWHGQTLKVSEKLDVSKTTLYEKMKRYGISAKKFK